MTGRAWGDDDPERRAERAAAYEKEKMRWRGWVGGNEKRVKQRQSRCMCRFLASPPTRLLHRPPAHRPPACCTARLLARRSYQQTVGNREYQQKRRLCEELEADEEELLEREEMLRRQRESWQRQAAEAKVCCPLPTTAHTRHERRHATATASE